MHDAYKIKRFGIVNWITHTHTHTQLECYNRIELIAASDTQNLLTDLLDIRSILEKSREEKRLPIYHTLEQQICELLHYIFAIGWEKCTIKAQFIEGCSMPPLLQTSLAHKKDEIFLF
jgi:hypothetical protein